MKHSILLLFLVLSIVGNAQANRDTLHVYFEFDRSEIAVMHLPELLSLRNSIESEEVSLIGIHSFCDTSGLKSYNYNLAKRRYSSVASNLRLSGSTLGFTPSYVGENYVADANYRAQDFRRVDVIYEVKVEEPIVEVEQPELIKKLTDFLLDSTVTETMIKLSIHFVPGEDALLPDSEPELYRLFEFMKYNQNIHAYIRGHVCCSSDMLLSNQRARVVHEYLAKRAISTKRMKYEGFSNTMPAVSPEVTEEDRISNRRVDVIFTKME